MINNIIFSKNRASQLRLLLYSIQKNAPGVFNLNVVYKYTDEQFKAGYELVKQEFGHICNFVEQTNNFKQDTLSLLDSENDFSCFFVDDDIIYKPVTSEDDLIKHIKDDEDVFCMSLRLGENVKIAYTMNTINVLHNQENLEDGMIKWDWSLHYLDFGYPLSLDGHIFRTKEILKLSKKIAFTNPNEFEGNLQIFDNFPRNKMVSYKYSVLVNTPNNIVNDTHPNRNGLTCAINVKELNEKYLKGEVINLESMNFEDIQGCHQELIFVFKK